MCCLKPIVTGSLDTGALHADFDSAICSGSSSVNAPLDNRPPSTLSAASPAVEFTLALVEASYVRSAPGTNAPKEAAAPSVSDSVGGTDPPTVPLVEVANGSLGATDGSTCPFALASN